MPVIKTSDKTKSKSLGSSLDKIPTEGKKYNLRFEKVTKTSAGGNSSKKLKCVTSNFKCLFYKRKARESDGRSESSKSSSPTGDSVHSSSPTSIACLSPDLGSRNHVPVSLPPIPSRRTSLTGSGTLDRPVPAPRSIRPSIVPISRIPSQQLIYDEQSSLRNFHLQSYGHIGPQGQLLFRAPTQNFRHPPPASAAGPPLPPRNHSNFPSVVYAPRNHGHGPMVAYVRGPFPPSRHPHNISMIRHPSHFPPPPHMVRVRIPLGQQAFALRYPPPPRLLFRSPYEHPNYCSLPDLPPSHNGSHNPSQSEVYSEYVNSHEADFQFKQLPIIPPRKQSLSAQSMPSLYPEEKHNMHFGMLQNLQRSNENKAVKRGKENQHSTNTEKVQLHSSAGNTKISNKKYTDSDGTCVLHNPSSKTICGSNPDINNKQASLWPTVLIDHKLPRVPNPGQENHQRQVVTQTKRQLGLLGNRKASLIDINDNNKLGNNASNLRHGSVSCSDLRKIDAKISEKSCTPWFRWFVRY